MNQGQITRLLMQHRTALYGYIYACVRNHADAEDILQNVSVAVTESIENGLSAIVHPTRLGGTRHFSAVQFVSEQRDALALVASQDGRFTVFWWSPSETMVRAHRVEALLM